MAVRTTRVERKAQTRSDLIAAGHRVFVERGFHAATLDDIADAAGYTKGAVYSNFRGKDDLFLALLDEHYERRVRAHCELMLGLDLDDPEETWRAIARIMIEAYERDPAWWTLVSDFSTHAARHPQTRGRLRGLVLDWILDPADESRVGVFEETVAAFLRGVAAPLDERSTE
jgi:AcrR family transcriptional regulator